MWCINSLAPGRCGCISKNGIFNLILLIVIFRSLHDNALRWMSQDLTDDKSTLVQVMAWCLQATSHYLSQCWLSSLSPYGIARPHWVNPYSSGLFHRHWGNNMIGTLTDWSMLFSPQKGHIRQPSNHVDTLKEATLNRLTMDLTLY